MSIQFDPDDSKEEEERFWWGIVIAVVLGGICFIFLPSWLAAPLMVGLIFFLGPLSARYGSDFWWWFFSKLLKIFKWIDRIIQ